MAFKITLPDGTQITCPSRAEAVELLQELRDEGLAALRPKRPSESACRDPWGSLAQALAVIELAADAGVSSLDLAQSIGLHASNQMGPRVRVWRRLVSQELGIDFSTVVMSRELARGHRRWFPKDRLQEVLNEALKRSSGSKGGA